MAQATQEIRRVRSDRVPPHNLDAEDSVLGAMMLSSDAIADVIEILKADEFYRRANGTIYEALLAMYARGEPVDAVTAMEELKRRGHLQDVGGALRIQELVELVPSPASASHYARIVSEAALLRRLISAAADIIELASSSPENPRMAAEQAEGRIYAASRHEDETAMVALQPVISAAVDEIEHIQQRESALAGLATGFRDIDELLSGLQAGNFIIIAARPGAGKSALAVNIARNVAVTERKPVALFSLEMSRWELGMRLLCGEAAVPMSKVRAGKIAAGDFSAFADAADTLHDAPMYIVDSGDVTILDIRAKARRLRSREGLSLIVVDYLQLMSPHRRVDNRQQEIAEISRSLKLLAKELDIPVVALSQLNRDPERREGAKPQLSNLRESGALEQDADVVMFIHREKDEDGHWVKGEAELLVAKHRNGPTGTIKLAFSDELIRFRNLYKG
jgi:replicative DNA helicase